jgi:hypothetical protein
MDPSDDQPLAYVFWHWPSAQVNAAEYESRQRDFHTALRDAPPRGFRVSMTHAIDHVPWSADGVAAYEDWYLVDDFTALGLLNEAAVSASRRAPHDSAAAYAAGGTAGFGFGSDERRKIPRSRRGSQAVGDVVPTLFAQLASSLRPSTAGYGCGR